MLPLLLASSSSYRRRLLARLQLPFDWAAPEVDETPQVGEGADALALRLAQDKACSLQERYPHHLIIGSDQVASLPGQILGKPGTQEKAQAQLEAASGRCMVFHTAVVLLNTYTGKRQTVCEPFKVHFRTLQKEEIRRYLEQEQPYDCAGSFKAEALGISLFQHMEGNDPTALVGLPLIHLCTMLRREGISCP